MNLHKVAKSSIEHGITKILYLVVTAALLKKATLDRYAKETRHLSKRVHRPSFHRCVALKAYSFVIWESSRSNVISKIQNMVLSTQFQNVVLG